MYKIYTRKSGRSQDLIHKIWRIMRLTIVIIIASLMQISAAGLAQKISMSKSNASLQNILQELRQQTGYDFLYTDVVLKEFKPVNIKVKNADFEEVLKKVFSNQPISYSLENKTVVLQLKEQVNKFGSLSIRGPIDVQGTVVDEKGVPLPGASVRRKGTNSVTKTDPNGYFVWRSIDENSVLQISFMGYVTKEVKVSRDLGIIRMELADRVLSEVGVVSTGYQKVPKERATGSFDLVNNELYNRTTGTDVVSRLNGISFAANLGGYQRPSGQLNHRISPLVKFSIRGLSTLLSDAKSPLLIVDNFPYEGDINNLNPNDVESVSILKDAAAGSIWGARAANGVIVITTKKGAFDKPLLISMNANVTIGAKPDLFYLPQMNSADLVDVQTFLYQKGRFNGSLASPYSYVPPVVDLLVKQSKDPGNPVYQQELDSWRNNDIRNDQLKYFYRKAVNQQYALNISGGSKQINYYFSGGYDKNLENLKTSGFDRINFKTNSTIRVVKNLEIEAGLMYTQNKYKERIVNDLYAPYSYLRLADDEGNALAVYPTSIRKNYTDTAGRGRLLDWSYKPISDQYEMPRIITNLNLLLNLGASYKLNSALTASIKYQLEKNKGADETRYNLGSFYTRGLINQYAQYNAGNPTSAVTFPIPIGNIIVPANSSAISSTWRGQLNFHKTWNDQHELNGIAGVELRDSKTDGFNAGPIYGYYDDPISLRSVNAIDKFPIYNDPDYFGTATISSGASFSRLVNRYTSYFANASYTFKNRYILSGSARKDASNIFGVKPNRRGQPFWSSGLSWIISQEPFFNFEYLSYLKLRATYGYQGNVSNRFSSYPIIAYKSGSSTVNQLPFASAVNPPNPSLGWETVGMLNLGLDFSARNNSISGSLEYYRKRSTNLIAPAPVPTSTGFSTLTMNSADLKGTGVEVNLRSLNLEMNRFKWETNLMFSYNKNTVTKYLLENTDANSFVMSDGGVLKSSAFRKGEEAYSLYAYKWAGLNPVTGAARGYVNGQVSEDYQAIINGKVTDLQNMGSISPHYFGSFLNTFSWRNFSLSANVIYKFDYVLGRTSIDYSGLAQGGLGNADYAKRWQQPGDEVHTNVPAFVYPTDLNASNFYLNSAVNVIKGDHIRLHDIVFSYALNKRFYAFNNLKLYANMNNVGIIWKANKFGIDPDAGNFYPNPRTISLGFNASF
ncbi:SusC/RagA family TonB-linked outer membrane protein [Pedobacter gandavensis]|uniref:SusC/RagA family TonB-linked outer membrane protein n=1 Tax=Pedobacter gandavensis TaxID=2679963 RepID=UPI0024784DAC|nr:SusC/RagA family TonB-linked outer membrane protein [Pedobacter gandavensis]WGQ11544.1 SusC/RagA family TonB-linked outer membrane protein [Pedobacter gandavensis]